MGRARPQAPFLLADLKAIDKVFAAAVQVVADADVRRVYLGGLVETP